MIEGCLRETLGVDCGSALRNGGKFLLLGRREDEVETLDVDRRLLLVLVPTGQVNGSLFAGGQEPATELNEHSFLPQVLVQLGTQPLQFVVHYREERPIL